MGRDCCHVVRVSAVVPRGTLYGTVRAAAPQTLSVHDELVERTMLLEDQAVDAEERAAQLALMVERLIDSRDPWRR